MGRQPLDLSSSSSSRFGFCVALAMHVLRWTKCTHSLEEDEFHVTLVSHRERPVAGLKTEVDEESCTLHDNINLDESLALISFGKFDMYGSNIGNVEGR